MPFCPISLCAIPRVSVARAALSAIQVGFLSLRLLLEQQQSVENQAASQTPHGSKRAVADLILMTASGPDLASCSAVGKLGSRLVALVCGLPEGGVKDLVPMCGALGARKLVLRAETDPDMATLCACRQVQSYTMPRCLVECCRGLSGMARDELRTLQQEYPELPPLRWESQLLKEMIGSLPQPMVMSLFWSLMKCFTSRRLVDFVERACEKRPVPRAARGRSLPENEDTSGPWLPDSRGEPCRCLRSRPKAAACCGFPATSFMLPLPTLG